MKNCRSGKEVWTYKMVRRWGNLVLMYQKACENPTVKIMLKILVEFLKILGHVFIRKILSMVFDET